MKESWSLYCVSAVDSYRDIACRSDGITRHVRRKAANDQNIVTWRERHPTLPPLRHALFSTIGAEEYIIL